MAVETLDGENKYDAGDHGLQVGTCTMYIYFVHSYKYTRTYMYINLYSYTIPYTSMHMFDSFSILCNNITDDPSKYIGLI